MAYPRKKAVKKTASRRKRKAPAKKMTEKETLEERLAEFLWTLCGLGGSLKFLEEYVAIHDAYRRLKPSARKEVKMITAEVLLKLKSIGGVVLRERGAAAPSKR